MFSRSLRSGFRRSHIRVVSGRDLIRTGRRTLPLTSGTGNITPFTLYRECFSHRRQKLIYHALLYNCRAKEGDYSLAGLYSAENDIVINMFDNISFQRVEVSWAVMSWYTFQAIRINKWNYQRLFPLLLVISTMTFFFSLCSLPAGLSVNFRLVYWKAAEPRSSLADNGLAL